jgi:hypothetical protein
MRQPLREINEDYQWLVDVTKQENPKS